MGLSQVRKALIRTLLRLRQVDDHPHALADKLGNGVKPLFGLGRADFSLGLGFEDELDGPLHIHALRIPYRPEGATPSGPSIDVIENLR